MSSIPETGSRVACVGDGTGENVLVDNFTGLFLQTWVVNGSARLDCNCWKSKWRVDGLLGWAVNVDSVFELWNLLDAPRGEGKFGLSICAFWQLFT